MQGLAFPGLSKLAVVPPFFNMLREGLADWNGFSLWLNPNTKSATAPAGELIFGGADTSRYTGQLQYHPNQSKRYEVTAPETCNDQLVTGVTPESTEISCDMRPAM